MQQTVRLETRGRVALVTIDNPPVNALSLAVRTGLIEVLERIEADAAIAAIVLVCAGTTFSAGADMREFGRPPQAPIMPYVLAMLDRSSKLTIAAIHGQALGGGLETALVFDYRCAVAAARFGLPEIKLGLFPGGGGTQRLPRLVGLEAAADLILSGEAIDAARARQLGIIDTVIDDDLPASAIRQAEALLAAGAPACRLSTRDVALTGRFDFAQRRAQALRDAKGLPAAAAAMDALQAATDRPFEEGLAEERRLFASVRDSREAAALRHLFMAEREVAKIPGLPKDIAPRDVRSAAVIGAGTMGAGIAMALANAAIPVLLVDTTQAALDRAEQSLDATYASQMERGRLSAEEGAARRARISTSLALEDCGAADIIIESVFEDMAVKQAVFRRLGAVARPGAMLATNTSALDINRIAAASLRAEDAVGLHFFSPANIMRLVEVVNAADTAPAVLAGAMALCKRMGKLGVVAGMCDGFIGNRMLRGYRREAEFLVLEGATPQQIDQALTTFGMAMGPHAMGDMAGLDISAAGRRRLRNEGLLSDERVGALQDQLVAMGRLGLKSGRGIYRYSPGSRKPEPDPELDAVLGAERARLGIRPRTIEAPEIIDRCLLPLVNEAARILEEGMAAGAADIDVVYCNGYGFPRQHGGPMFWADRLGLAEMVARIERFAQRHGPQYWTPAPLLLALAKAGTGFADLPRGGARPIFQAMPDPGV